MKKVALYLVLISALIISMGLCACDDGTYEAKEPVNDVSYSYLKCVYRPMYPNDGYIYVDTETGVMYIVFQEGTSGCICPMYNSDGSLKVYNPEG